MIIFTPNTVISSTDVNGNFDELKTKTDYLSTPDTDWHEIGAASQPAFQNSWVNYNDGFNTAAYMKCVDGFVHLKGLIRGGTIGTTAFTLPTGYRPALTCLSTEISNQTVLGRVDVQNDGQVVIGAGHTNWIPIENIVFRAEQ